MVSDADVLIAAPLELDSPVVDFERVIVLRQHNFVTPRTDGEFVLANRERLLADDLSPAANFDRYVFVSTLDVNRALSVSSQMTTPAASMRGSMSQRS